MSTTPGRMAEAASLIPEDDSVDAVRMSFGEHLDELRACLIRALVGLAFATAAALMLHHSVLEIVFKPLWVVQRANGLQPNVQSLSPPDTFAAYLKMALLAGAIAAMPWMLYQAWRFVSLGLYAHERRFAKRLTIVSTGLFMIGVLFLYFIVLPIVLQFFISFNRKFEAAGLTPTMFQQLLLPNDGTKPVPVGELVPAVRVPVRWDNPEHPREGEIWINLSSSRLVVQGPDGPRSAALNPGATASAVQSQFAVPAYISFVLMLALGFGLAFETPIVVCFLVWSGLVSTAEFVRGRRYIALGIVVAAAVLTPPDVLSQILMAIPMYALFEGGIVAARFVERRRAA